MKIEKPIPQAKIPGQISAHKYIELYTEVMKLPPNMVIPVTFESPTEAAKFTQTVAHSTFAKFRAMQRHTTVYVRLWNEEDDARMKHIKELRAKRRAKTVSNVSNGGEKDVQSRAERTV